MRRLLTPEIAELVGRARALAALRPVVDETTAVLVALCNEITGMHYPVPKPEVPTDPRVSILADQFTGKRKSGGR